MRKRHFFQKIQKPLWVMVLLTLTFSNLPSVVFDQIGLNKLAEQSRVPEARAAVGDGTFMYHQSTPSYNYQSRTWTESSATVGSPTVPFSNPGSLSKHSLILSSPSRQEFLLGVQGTNGTLTVYKSTDEGASWISQWSVTVGDSNLARFDIAYEKTSGDALVVYSGNVATDGQELKYYTWDGSTWVGPTNLGSARTTGTVDGIKLAERSGSNEIGLVYADTNFDLSTNLWTGSAWFGEPAAALSVSISKIGTSTVPTNRAYDLVFESLSGDLMVIWGEDAVLDPKYVIKPAGGAWGSTVSPTTFTEEGTVMAVSASPISDKIAYVNCTDNGGDCDFAIWSGSVWGTAINDATSGTPIAGDSGNKVEWLIDGANEVAIYTYNDAQGGNIDWYTSTNGGQPAVQTDNSTAPAVTGSESSVGAYRSPSSSSQGIFMFGDNSTDIFVKKVSLSGTTVTWSSPTGAATAIESNSSVIGYNHAAFAYTRFAVQTLTIGATAGQMVDSLESGGVSQYVNATDCTSASTCAAFRISLSSGSETITSIKVTESTILNATNNLSNFALFYDTDGNFSNGVIGQYGTTVAAFTAEAATVSGSLAISAGTTYYFYARLDLAKSGTYPQAGESIILQIASTSDVGISGTPTKTGTPSLYLLTKVRPKITAVSNGAGLSDGARSGESVTISGYGFGAPSAGANRQNCSNVNRDYGCIRFDLATPPGTEVNSAYITAWSNTAVTFTINATNLAGFGNSTNPLEIVAAGLNSVWAPAYYIYPNITGMTTCSSGGNRDSACGTNAAQEYAAGDTFGLIQLNGDHFRTAAGTITFNGAFGSITAIVHNTVEGPCSVAGWGSTGTGTSVCVQVPSSISNSVYDGTILLTRGTDNKTHSIDLHILPRIASNTATAGSVGDVIQIDGDHFCQTGTCPATPPNADSIAYFGSTQALSTDFVTTPNCTGASKWSHAQVCVKVPAGTPTGSQKTKVQGKTTPLYESNRKDFTIQSNVPGDPVVTTPPQRQFKADNTTTIAVGGVTTETQAYLKADLSASLVINMRLQIEVQPVGTAFTCTGTNAIGAGGCAAYASGSGVLEGTVAGGGGCDACSSASQAQINFTGLSDSTKHWQARARNSTTNEYSAWVSFGANAESATDFKVNSTGPVITNISSGTPGTNSATITWDTSVEASSTQVQYNKTGTFVTNCVTNNDCTTLTDIPPSGVSIHSVALSNLDSATTYYYRVRSKDEDGNETISGVNTFVTGSVTQPVKTTSFFISGATGTIVGGTSTAPTFSVLTSETSPSIKSAFVEITGITVDSGINPSSFTIDGTFPAHEEDFMKPENIRHLLEREITDISNTEGTNTILAQANSDISVQVNSQAVRIYAINTNTITYFKIIYEITPGNLNLNDTPTINTLTISPSLDLYISSAKIVVTYSYTP